jgi:ADP-heptose:LPS heptosyltransferase
MNETLIVMRDEQVGDALMSLPALHALAWELAKDRLIYAAFTCREVAEIAEWPINVRDILRFEPQFGLGSPGGPAPYADCDVIVLGIAAAIAYQFHDTMLHPTQCLMAWAGLDVPDHVPQPKLNVPDMDVPAYDFIVAPWSRARDRSLETAEAVELVDTLAQLCDEPRIAILGGVTDPFWPVVPWHPGGVVAYEYGKPWPYVVNLMRRCKKAVITTDSAPSRLAHAAGITNHVLLAASVTPPQWQSHPGVHMVYGPPRQWKLDQILDAVQAAKETVTA